MKRLFDILILGGFAAVLSCGSAQAAFTEEIYTGRQKDGVLILPKKLALECPDFDITKDDAVAECVNKLLRMNKAAKAYEAGDAVEIFREAYRQMNSEYNQIALTKKHLAGDVENQIEKETGEDKMDGAFADKGERIRKKQEQSVNLSAMATKNMVDLMDVYSSSIALQNMHYIYTYEFSKDSAAVPEKED